MPRACVLRTVGVAAVLLVLAVAGASAQVSTTEMHEGLLHELSVDRAIYVMHESVSIAYSVTNESGGDIWLEYGCGYVTVALRVLDPDDQPIWIHPSGCLDVIWWDEFLAGEFYAEQQQWNMTDDFTLEPISEPGVYTVQGMLTTYTEPYFHILSLEITIVGAETVVSEEQTTTWSLIKALYQ